MDLEEFKLKICSLPEDCNSVDNLIDYTFYIKYRLLQSEEILKLFYKKFGNSKKKEIKEIYDEIHKIIILSHDIYLQTKKYQETSLLELT